MRGLRVTLSAGFSGGRYWSVCSLPAPTSFPILGKPMNLRWLVRPNDGSTVSSLSLLIATCSQRRLVRFQVYLVLSPLYGLMVSRYRRGHAFAVYLSGWELRPTSRTKLLRIFSFPLIPSRMNGYFEETGRTAQGALCKTVEAVGEEGRRYGITRTNPRTHQGSRGRIPRHLALTRIIKTVSQIALLLSSVPSGTVSGLSDNWVSLKSSM